MVLLNKALYSLKGLSAKNLSHTTLLRIGIFHRIITTEARRSSLTLERTIISE